LNGANREKKQITIKGVRDRFSKVQQSSKVTIRTHKLFRTLDLLNYPNIKQQKRSCFIAVLKEESQRHGLPTLTLCFGLPSLIDFSSDTKSITSASC
jgi:hypothetical protein